eukprot:gnl/TRDRNA2_/TRDRNA2_157782_c2_seq3.p1 gnl/TRDRNA2_/TRDRNA2_157782_c2~~gnl/TRDRNA2_/TRDRNA2_157782_c2_seq3.p1  ORF type:complete len:495 (+),score=56.89 gnl/TRDRNA2_/TRDRNA2_157782_c2_seq3:75-1559(+)
MDQEMVQAHALAMESVPVPVSFRCPITHELMTDPVVTHDGYVYERTAIAGWFQRGHRTSPMTGAELPSLALTPEEPLRRAIEEYTTARPGIARIARHMLDDHMSLETAAQTLEAEARVKSGIQARNVETALKEAWQIAAGWEERARRAEHALQAAEEMLDVMRWREQISGGQAAEWRWSDTKWRCHGTGGGQAQSAQSTPVKAKAVQAIECPDEITTPTGSSSSGSVDRSCGRPQEVTLATAPLPARESRDHQSPTAVPATVISPAMAVQDCRVSIVTSPALPSEDRGVSVAAPASQVLVRQASAPPILASLRVPRQGSQANIAGVPTERPAEISMPTGSSGDDDSSHSSLALPGWEPHDQLWSARRPAAPTNVVSPAIAVQGCFASAPAIVTPPDLRQESRVSAAAPASQSVLGQEASAPALLVSPIVPAQGLRAQVATHTWAAGVLPSPQRTLGSRTAGAARWSAQIAMPEGRGTVGGYGHHGRTGSSYYWR